jgi:alpha-L-rhamnosidase
MLRFLKISILFFLLQYTKIEAQPVNLKCAFISNPVGIDDTLIQFNWELSFNEKLNGQTRYQIMIATRPELLLLGKPDIYDSSFINSMIQGARINLPKLKSYTRYYWTVKIIGGYNKAGIQSKIEWFETAKIQGKEGWRAQWITDGNDKEYRPAPLFRKSFNLKLKPVSARVYISGLGYYTFFINGNKVGIGSLNPGYTDFSKRVLYLSYDVTKQLLQGANVLAVELGNGWFNNQTPTVWNYNLAPWRARPQLICELHIKYSNGSTEIIASDKTWKTSTGALQYDNLYVGSVYDARLEKIGWNQKKFDDSKWGQVKIVTSPALLMQSQMMPEIGVSRMFSPASFNKLNPYTYVYSMGENIAGVVKLKVKGSAGTKITIRYGEWLDRSGRLDQSNINMHLRGVLPGEKVIQKDEYILKGIGIEEHIPSYTYHGFQYVEVTSDRPIDLDINSIKGLVLHSMVDSIGSFSCSNQLLNKIYDNCKRSYLSNLFGIPTDCPHREKNGWMADGFMVQEAGMLNYNSRAIYSKWVNDMADAQEPNGDVPGVVPTSWNWDSDWAGPIWDAAIFKVPDLLYTYYGDTKPYDAIYETCKKYLLFLDSCRDQRGLLTKGLGDWLYYKSITPVDFMTTCYYYDDCMKMAKMSRLLKKGDEDYYLAKAAAIKKNINKYFFNADSVTYGNKTQLSFALPLSMGIVPEGYEKKLAANLVQAIHENDYSLDFGFIGSAVVPQVLSDYGYNEVMYKIINKTTLPSYGYWIEKWKATSLFEAWDITKNIGDASLNHPSMGSVSAWMIKSLAGINIASDAIAFEKIVIKPSFIKDLNFVRASHNSIKGLVVSEWKRIGKMIELNVVIPANTKALIVLPNKEVLVGAGKHRFEVKSVLD